MHTSEFKLGHYPNESHFGESPSATGAGKRSPGIPNTMRKANVILADPRANYVTVASTGVLRNGTKVTNC
jgi:hypothetical protein